jgi:hypothetical protein
MYLNVGNKLLMRIVSPFDDLKVLEEKEITIQHLALVRDLFLFSCYTGFAYVDVANLTVDYIKIGIDGNRWLIKNRR